jgi:hypothetical protein
MPSPDRESQRKLVVDLAKGRIVFRAKRMDLSNLDVSDLGIEMTVDGRTWSLAVPLARAGRDWAFRGRPAFFEALGGQPDPNPGPGPSPFPGPWPDPDPDPDPKPVITWQEIAWGHDARNVVQEQVVARTQTQYDALWSRTPRLDVPPAIDFGQEMVVGIFAGRRIAAKVSIASVKRVGAEVHVTWRVVADTNRYFAPVPPYPYYLFRMTKTNETVRFFLVP